MKEHLPAAGTKGWRGILEAFWQPFNTQLQTVNGIGVRQVIDEIDAMLGPHLFPVQVSILNIKP